MSLLSWFGSLSCGPQRFARTITVAVAAFASTLAYGFQFEILPVRLGTNSGVGLVADFNGDGRIEALGSLTTAAGRVVPVDLTDIGLDSLQDGDERLFSFSDGRAVDVNGDGATDLITQSYGSASIETNARLFINDGRGHFRQDQAFADLNLSGRGEGLVVADFNNDGYVDVYLPYYTFDCDSLDQPDPLCPNAPQSYLLLNDGSGGFTEVAERAGVAQKPDASEPLFGLQPEGSQAVDVDDNGYIDIMTAGKVFLNTGTNGEVRGRNGRTLRIPAYRRCDCGIPKPQDDQRADEGAKFTDWDNDGRLDLVLHHWNRGPRLYEARGARPEFVSSRTAGGITRAVRFQRRRLGKDVDRNVPVFHTVAPLRLDSSFGINIADLDNDGYEDLYLSSSATPVADRCGDDRNLCPTYVNLLFRNTGTRFEESSSRPLTERKVAGNVVFGDVNGDGRMDAYLTNQKRVYLNRTGAGNADAATLRIDVRGPDGQRNQFGRVVRVRLPLAGCKFGTAGCTLTRVVDGGSGYRSQNQYPLLIGTPVSGRHVVSILFFYDGQVVETRFKMRSGQRAKIFAPSAAAPQGRVDIRG